MVISNCIKQANRLQWEGSLEEAISEYRRAIEINPNSAWSHHNLAEVLVKQGALEEAVSEYRRAIEINPSFYGFYKSLGKALSQQGNTQAAEDAYRRANERNPNCVSNSSQQVEINASGTQSNLNSGADSIQTTPYNPQQLLQDMERDGFILLRNVLTSDEIDKMRSAIYEYLNNNDIAHKGFLGDKKSGRWSLVQPDALNLIPDMRWILRNSLIKDVMTLLLGETPAYCHHSDAHFNWIGGWHRDSIAKASYFDFCANNDIFSEEATTGYRVYKVAIYFQDHTQNKGGLNVCPGSHRCDGPKTDFPNEQHIDTRKGDVIIFNTKLYHRGLTDKQIVKSPAFLQGEDRMSIFYTFGVQNKYTVDFVRGTMWRQNRQLGRKNYVLSEELRQELLTQGFEIIPLEPNPMPSAESVLEQFYSMQEELIALKHKK